LNSISAISGQGGKLCATVLSSTRWQSLQVTPEGGPIAAAG
jgi:hypothetical protein